MITSTHDKSRRLFVSESDRKLGLFHKIKFNQVIGRRKGIIFECENGSIYAIHLILSATGKTKRSFSYDFNKTIHDNPFYWLRITWRSPTYWKHWGICGFKKTIGSIEFAKGINAESLI